MAGRPLRPATRRRLGGPLPRQLADGPRTHLVAALRPFLPGSEDPVSLPGISQPFGWLSRTSRQIIHVLRTRSPLPELPQSARLACVKRAASVRSEPGSNSPKFIWSSDPSVPG